MRALILQGKGGQLNATTLHLQPRLPQCARQQPLSQQPTPSPLTRCTHASKKQTLSFAPRSALASSSCCTTAMLAFAPACSGVRWSCPNGFESVPPVQQLLSKDHSLHTTIWHHSLHTTIWPPQGLSHRMGSNRGASSSIKWGRAPAFVHSKDALGWRHNDAS
jgi:hypothetical protein